MADICQAHNVHGKFTVHLYKDECMFKCIPNWVRRAEGLTSGNGIYGRECKKTKQTKKTWFGKY